MSASTFQWLPGYLIVGDDELKRQAVLERLRTRFSTMGDLDFNSDEFSAVTVEPGTVRNACLTPPMTSPKRLVVVKEVEAAKKALSEELRQYLAHPTSTTILVLVATKMAKTSALYKAMSAFGKNAVIVCDAPRARELPALVRDMAKLNGVEFSPAAARVLIDLVGTDTLRLNGEVEKVALAHRGIDPVSDAEVIAVVTPTAEIKPWEFIAALSARDLKRALRYWDRMPSTRPLAMVSQCAKALRELLCTQSLLARGAIQELPVVLKKKDWQVKNHRQWATRWESDELWAALQGLQEAERAMKTGQDGREVLREWIAVSLKKSNR